MSLLLGMFSRLVVPANPLLSFIDGWAAHDLRPQAKQLKLPSFLQPVLSAVKAVEEWHEYVGPGAASWSC